MVTTGRLVVAPSTGGVLPHVTAGAVVGGALLVVLWLATGRGARRRPPGHRPGDGFGLPRPGVAPAASLATSEEAGRRSRTERVGLLASSVGWITARLRRSRGRGVGAHWATVADVRSLLVPAPVPGRLTIGTVRRRLLAAESGHSVLVVGPTQSGKTTGLAIPAILEWDGPVLAASVKGDLARHTMAWRRTRGRVWVYDPTAAAGLAGDRWSPLEACRSWAQARTMAASLTEVARSSGAGLTDGDFWYATAAKLLGPLLLAAASSNRTMADVVAWIDEQVEDEVADALEAGGHREALRAARATWNRDDRQRSAVYTTAETIVEAFADPTVAAASQPGPGTIDPTALVGSDDTLYLCAPAHHQRQLRPLFATIATQILDAAYDLAARCGGRLERPLLVVLDEAANVTPLAELDSLASTAASHGIQLVTVWQDLAQLNARYGPRAGTVVNNHRLKLFLPGIADPGTLDHASQLVGDEEHHVQARTVDGYGHGSTTDSPVTRRLLPSDELRRLRPGTAVAISGHLPPIRVSLRPWHHDPELRRRAQQGMS